MKTATWMTVSLACGFFAVSGAMGAAPAMQLSKHTIPLDIQFGEGKDILKRGPHNAPILKNFQNELSRYSIVHMQIEGTPDPWGTPESNKRLSRKRAEALRDTLVELYGIDPGRVQVLSAGESGAGSPVAHGQSRAAYVILYTLDSPAAH